MFAIKYDDVLVVTGNELEQINYKFCMLHLILTPACSTCLRERGCVQTIAVNIANEINILRCVTFVTNYALHF